MRSLPGKLTTAIILSAFLFSCKKNVQETMEHERFAAQTISATEAAVGICDYEITEASLISSGWTKRFEDNFSGTLDQWNIWTGGAYNYELQYYNPTNLKIDAASGTLTIEARRETVTGATLPTDQTPKKFDFTSGRIEAKTHFSSSPTTPKVRMAARIKLPKGTGMWPAFWSYGDPWPTQGEIDIMEAKGQQTFQYSTAYWYGRNANKVQGSDALITTNVDLSECFHVYELIWEKDKLTYSLDGNIVNTKSGGSIPNMYKKQQRVVLNLAVGGLFFGNPPLTASDIQTGSMQVDWVKVFTAK